MYRPVLPFVRPTLCFIVGVISSGLYVNHWVDYTILAVFLLSFFLLNKRKGNLNKSFQVGLIVCVLFFFLGKIRTNQQEGQLTHLEEKVSHYVVLVKEKHEKLTSTSIHGKIVQFKTNEGWEKAAIPILLFTKDTLSISEYDQLLIKGSPKQISKPLNPNEFDYADFMKRRGVLYQAFLRKKDVLQVSTNHQVLKGWSSSVRNYLSGQLQQQLDNQEAFSIANSLLLGVRDQLDKNLTESYVNAGTIHVLAVSGLHVGLLYVSLNFIFGFVRKGKLGNVIRAVLVLGGIWSYATITNYSLPVLRASIMLSAVVIAEASNRNSSKLNALFFSAFLMLFYNPNYFYEIGFQYSFLAMAGIIFLYPYLSKWVQSRYSLVQSIWNMVAVSLSAQLLIFPFSIYYFHQFSNYFLLGNILVLPLISILVPIGFFFFLMSPFPFIQHYIGYVLEKGILCVNWIVRLIESISGSVSTQLYFSLPQSILLFILILVVILLFVTRNKKYLLLACVLGGVNFFLFIQRELKISTQQEWISYSGYKANVTDFMLGDQLLTIDRGGLDKMLTKVENNRIIHRSNDSIHHENIAFIQKENYSLICHNGKTYFFPKRKPFLNQRLKMNYVILHGKWQDSKLIQAQQKIFHGKCDCSMDNIYCVSKEGAFEKSL